MIVRTFGWSFVVTVLVLGAALLLAGPGVAATVAILAVLEISLSFDNAVVNATVLARLSPYWQRLFLTLGMVIAVFGMRLVFPLAVVAASAKMGPIQAVRLALAPGHGYEFRLALAHPMIAAFGGMFLLLLFLDFFLTPRTTMWLTWLERPLARLGRVRYASVVLGLVVLAVVGGFFSDDPPGPAKDSTVPVLVSGVLGMVVYLLLRGLNDRFEEHGPGGKTVQHGKAALLLFLYLEVLDASFSFDGVIGAFAITDGLFLIAAGLGVGALFIRSMTIYLVHRGTLQEYEYLEHGAHWAIGALATAMLVGIPREVPDIVSGCIGAGFILVAFLSSMARNHRSRVVLRPEIHREHTPASLYVP